VKRTTIEPFVAATLIACKGYFFEEPEQGFPSVIKDLGQTTEQWDISAIISLGGDAKGTIVLSINEKLALYLAGKVTGEVSTIIDDEVLDVFAEGVNIIAGNAKKDLTEYTRIILGLPTIVHGKINRIKLSNQLRDTAMAIPFHFSEGTMMLSVGLEDEAGYRI